MTKAEKARELFMQGYNCSQSIAGAFCDEMGVDFEKAVSLVSGLGGGVGRLREVCGAFTGITLVLSSLENYVIPDDTKKKELYEKVQELSKGFAEMNGSIICRDILSLSLGENDSPTPQERNEEYYSSRPCARVVFNAAKILEEYINSQENS